MTADEALLALQVAIDRQLGLRWVGVAGEMRVVVTRSTPAGEQVMRAAGAHTDPGEALLAAEQALMETVDARGRERVEAGLRELERGGLSLIPGHLGEWALLRGETMIGVFPGVREALLSLAPNGEARPRRNRGE